MTQSTLTLRSFAPLVLAVGVIAGSVSQASALDSNVRRSCMGDYLTYCSSYGINVSKVSRCMRRNGSRLSKRCVNALVMAGYVSKSEVARRQASLHP